MVIKIAIVDPMLECSGYHRDYHESHSGEDTYSYWAGLQDTLSHWNRSIRTLIIGLQISYLCNSIGTIQ